MTTSRRPVPLSALIVLCTAAVDAAAAEPARRATADDLRQRAIGDDRIPPTIDPMASGATPAAGKGGAKVIFVNFDGVELTQGQDDSLGNVSQICGGSFPPYGDGPKREATLQAILEDWERYDVVVTTDRPESGDYTMAVISNVPQSECSVNSPAIYGVAPMDCGDHVNNIVFAFHSEDDQHSAQHHATVASQEIAHSYGLDHTNNPDGIMNPTPTGGNQFFDEECKPNAGLVFCADQHAEYCPGGELRQDSHVELLGLIGEREPDTSPPLVSIVAPMDGDELDIGLEIDVLVDATDDRSVSDVALEVDGAAAGAPLTSAPYQWALTELATGSHTLVATARDLDGNEASDSITISIVSPDTGSDDTGGAGADDDDNDEDGVPTEDDGASSPPGDTDADQNDALGGRDDGCSCRSGRRSSAALWLSLFVLALARRPTSLGALERV